MDILNTISTIQWQQPLWFLLAFQPLILWLYLRKLTKKTQQAYADEHLLPWIKVKSTISIRQKIISRDTAYILAWLCFAATLVNPQIPLNKTVDTSNPDLDIMLVVDLSQSMNATDIKPTRLRRAVLEAYELLSFTKNSRIGIIVYAGRAHLFVPLTSDFNALKFYLKDLDSLKLPTLGSNSASAILLAQKELMKKGTNSKNIIWMTDGDLVGGDGIDFDENEFHKVSQAIQHNVISTYILAITSEQGAEIPLANGTWLTVDGKAVISKPNLVHLHKLAKRGGGVLSMVKGNETDWEILYKKCILSNTSQSTNTEKRHWKSLYQWFLFPALIFLLIALFAKSLPATKTFFALFIISSIITFTIAKANEPFLDHINQGINAYKSKELSQARSQFIQAVLKANSDEARAIALHNLGNSLFQEGDYETASKLFSDALRYNSKQTQSNSNQELSKELHEILERRQSKAQLIQGNYATPNENSLLLEIPDNLPADVNTKALNTTQFKLPELPTAELDRLLKNGLAFIQLLQNKKSKNAKYIKQVQQNDTARQYLIELGEQGSAPSILLWKRLFEIEEGFAGQLKEPKKLPGVKPW